MPFHFVLEKLIDMLLNLVCQNYCQDTHEKGKISFHTLIKRITIQNFQFSHSMSNLQNIKLFLINVLSINNWKFQILQVQNLSPTTFALFFFSFFFNMLIFHKIFLVLIFFPFFHLFIFIDFNHFLNILNIKL